MYSCRCVKSYFTNETTSQFFGSFLLIIFKEHSSLQFVKQKCISCLDTFRVTALSKGVGCLSTASGLVWHALRQLRLYSNSSSLSSYLRQFIPLRKRCLAKMVNRICKILRNSAALSHLLELLASDSCQACKAQF